MSQNHAYDDLHIQEKHSKEYLGSKRISKFTFLLIEGLNVALGYPMKEYSTTFFKDTVWDRASTVRRFRRTLLPFL